jgi:hypothetical protein
MNGSDIYTLQTDLDGLEEWAVENAIKIDQCRSKSVCYTMARVKDALNNFWGTKESRKRVAADI